MTACTAPQPPDNARPPRDWAALSRSIEGWGRELGFAAIGISDIDLAADETRLLRWLEAGYHGAMDYMARHGAARARPATLVPGTICVISARMHYLAPGARTAGEILGEPRKAAIARYALGRDYHKVMRGRLQRLADRIADAIGPFGHRVFVDSAPVMEVALATKAGIGWRGKHTLLLTRNEGSWFFLGEIFVDIPLPTTPAQTAHCGSCRACIDACPTGAIVAPHELDARRCISYLTIEFPGSIPLALRPLIGNRIYGCDDCQLACPWNRFAKQATLPDFDVRHGLDDVTLTELFAWTGAQFDERMRGSAIRRIGFERWSRNLAVALGNAPPDASIKAALAARAGDPSALVREHVGWALERQNDTR